MRRALLICFLAVATGTSVGHAQDPDPEAEVEADEAEGDADADADADADEAEAEAEGDADADAESEPADVEGDAVPAAEIGRRIEETFQQLQLLTPLLRRQTETRNIERMMPNFVDHITELSDDPALDHLDTLHSASLQALEHEWGSMRERLTLWQDGLETRTSDLTEANQKTIEARDLWRRTKETQAETLPESQLERVDTLLERIDTVLRRLERRLNGVLALQGELSDQGIRIARQASRIEAAQQQVRDRRQRRDHRPVWRGWGRLGEDEADASRWEVVQEHLVSMSAFFYSQKKSLFKHGAVLLFLMMGFVALRVRSRSRTEPGKRPSAHRALLARPVASALLLSFILAPFVYDYVPVIIIGASLIAIVPVVELLNRHLLPKARRSLLALMVLSGLSVPLSLSFTPEWMSRLYTLVLGAVSLRFVYLLWSRALHRSAGDHERRLYRFLRFAMFPLLYGMFLLFTGFIERAELWTAGTLWVLEQAVAIFLATELVTALATLALRHPSARVFYLVRNHRRKVTHYLSLGLRISALFVLVVLALRSFDLLDPTVEGSRAAFERTFVFGSIELSFGSIVAFFVMLIGTFLMMRVVHVLLEHEILPRFNLEQGISSAISLSASYLLVAIGVVLAFGVAGVGPERLALLGGALGVGIGFGLQNVVSNFVSGLILVAERPIKVGDVIEVDGDLVGTVQRIGIRSSSVHSLDGAEVIVPNADLVSGKLINWTLTDARRRFDLVVGAGYADDPAKVMRVLNQVVRRQPLILHDPAPEVLCSTFADSAIEYTVRAWAGGYLEAIEAKSALAVAVHAAFAEHEIEIPFPQQDLHIKSPLPAP